MPSLTNPYAPPAAAEFVLPTPVLPPGVRRFGLDLAAYRLLLRSRVRRRGPVIVAVVAVVIAINGLSGLPALLTSGVLAVGCILGLGIAWFGVSRVGSAQLATFEVLASDRVVRRILKGTLPAEVLRPEVTRIVETRFGLWVLCTTPRRSLALVRAIAGYADLREHLARWRPIEELKGWPATRMSYAERGRQGPRDVMVGTALATDATLVEELGTVRAVSADRGAGYGAPTLVRHRLLRMAMLWVLILVLFLALWQLLQPR
jgi:hypothetical protein